MNLNHILSIVGVIIIVLLAVLVVGGVIMILFFKRFGNSITKVEQETIFILRKLDNLSFDADAFGNEMVKIATHITAVLIGFINDVDNTVKYSKSLVTKLKPLLEGASRIGKTCKTVIDKVGDDAKSLEPWHW